MKRKFFGITLMVIGITIILTAISIRFYGEYKQKKILKDFENTLISMGEDNNTKGDMVSSTTAVTTPESSTIPDQKEPTPAPEISGTIGIMTIPKISLKIALSEGTTDEVLKYAVGHFKDTAMPGEIGNSSFAGHRNYTYNEFFNRLDEVKIGDDIIVRTKKGEFKYKVYEKKVVLPTEVSVLDATKDATITLITCTPIRVATHRLIIKGRLEK